jgi:hypothetical protein
MGEKKDADIPAIVIKVTVKKTNVLDQYAGKIIAKSKGYKKLEVDYIWDNPLMYKEKLDIKIIDENHEIKIDESLYLEKPNFNQKYKYLISWAFNIILTAVEIYSNNKDAGIPNPEKDSFKINKTGLNLIFGEKNQ